MKRKKRRQRKKVKGAKFNPRQLKAVRALVRSKKLGEDFEAALRLGLKLIVFEDAGAFCVSTGEEVIARVESPERGPAKIVWTSPNIKDVDWTAIQRFDLVE
jgi:hypothetical protein